MNNKDHETFYWQAYTDGLREHIEQAPLDCSWFHSSTKNTGSDDELFRRNDYASISLEELLHITINGFKECEVAREEENYCFCIRGAFQDERIYRLYQKCREFYLQELAKLILVKLIEGEKNEGKRLYK